MCITEYNEELHINNEKKISREEGALEMLISLVKDGLIAIEEGAKKMGMSVEDFQKKMNAI